MASVMQRPRSTQPVSHDVNYGDIQRGPALSSSSSNVAGRQTQGAVPQPPGVFEGDVHYRNEHFGDGASHHYGGGPTAADRGSSFTGGVDGGRYFGGDPYMRGGHVSSGYGHGLTHVQGHGDSQHGYYGGYEDEAALLADSSSAPPGASGFETDFELDLAASHLNATLAGGGASGAAVPDTTFREAGEMQDAPSDADLATAGSFQFPELPASLLDQGPEYEYSSHTQTNVFDAVQEYGDEGDDEAARYYGLDRYDPALLDSVTTAQGALGADETLWAYDGPQHHDPLTAMSQISGADAFSTLQGASPSFLGDYADEPSTAPTSRASEWRGEAGGSGSGGVVGGNNASNGGGGAFLPRNSPYGSSMHHTPKRRRDSPTQLSPHLSSANAAPGSHWNSRIVSAFQPHLSSSSSSSSSSRPVAGRAYRSNEPMVPSQPHPHPMSSDTHSRMASWTGEEARLSHRPAHHHQSRHHPYAPHQEGWRQPHAVGAMAALGPPPSVRRSLNQQALYSSNSSGNVGSGTANGANSSSDMGPPSSSSNAASNQQQHYMPRLKASSADGQMVLQPQALSKQQQQQQSSPDVQVPPNLAGVPPSVIATAASAPPNSNSTSSAPPLNNAANSGSQSQAEMLNALGNAMDSALETEGVAKCPYPDCNKTFAKNRSYNLKAHLRSHSQLKPFACAHCPRAFSRKHDLERHARVHSGDKPYICEACGKGFPRSDALRRHWRVEKECGDKAAEIEAGQPLPSLPPGVNAVPAQATQPVPGFANMSTPSSNGGQGPTTTATPHSIYYSSSGASGGWDTAAYATSSNGGDRKRIKTDL